MPYINVRVGRTLTQQERDTLAERIGKLVEIIPEKYYDKTMVDIDDGCRIYRGGQQQPCLFMETRLYQENDLAAKEKYTEQLFALFDEVLGIPAAQVYMNILELKHWASKGKLR